LKDFTEFQFSWLIFIFTISTQLLITSFYIAEVGDRPIGTNGFLIIISIFLLVYLLFYGLTTKISADTITVSFGIGLIRKRILINRISKVETVKTPWYYGYGIRFIPNGMLYNISGSEGIEIEFNDTKRVVRIGSKNPGLLKLQIEKRIK
jgi:sulfite exporter TauE/SafE